MKNLPVKSSIIDLNFRDDPFTRVRKMCKNASFNPRESDSPLVGHMAEILLKYMELDKQVIRQNAAEDFALLAEIIACNPPQSLDESWPQACRAVASAIRRMTQDYGGKENET